jgi:hypothetical protein
MNSAHQWWSRWTAVITPDPARAVLDHAAVREHCARFYRKAFGSVTALCITDGPVWTVDCRTEGHPAHDRAYRAWMTGQLRRFLRNGFGPKAAIDLTVTLEAGDRQDGTPPDQCILGPPPVVLDTRLLRS